MKQRYALYVFYVIISSPYLYIIFMLWNVFHDALDIFVKLPRGQWDAGVQNIKAIL